MSTTTTTARVRSHGHGARPTEPGLEELHTWVEEISALTQPNRIHWVDGSPAENETLLREMVDGGQLIRRHDSDERRYRPVDWYRRPRAGGVW